MDNIVYDFYSTSCVPCKMISKKMDELIATYSDLIPFKKIDVDDGNNKYLIDKFEISSIPTVVVVKDGYEIDRFHGTTIPKELDILIKKEFIDQTN